MFLGLDVLVSHEADLATAGNFVDVAKLPDGGVATLCAYGLVVAARRGTMRDSRKFGVER